jgi:hypothetical protein
MSILLASPNTEKSGKTMPKGLSRVWNRRLLKLSNGFVGMEWILPILVDC